MRLVQDGFLYMSSPLLGFDCASSSFDVVFYLGLTTANNSPGLSGISLVVPHASGGNPNFLPTPPFSCYPLVYLCRTWPAGSNPTSLNTEIIALSNVSTDPFTLEDTFTIARAQSGTTARNIQAGDNVEGVYFEGSSGLIVPGLWDITAAASLISPSSYGLDPTPLPWDTMQIDIWQQAFCGFVNPTLYGSQFSKSAAAFKFPSDQLNASSVAYACAGFAGPYAGDAFYPQFAISPYATSCGNTMSMHVATGDTPCPEASCQNGVFLVFKTAKQSGAGAPPFYCDVDISGSFVSFP